MINLFSPEHCDQVTLEPYLDLVLNALVATFQSASLLVLSPCLLLLG
jgi:hypothetical protein